MKIEKQIEELNIKANNLHLKANELLREGNVQGYKFKVLEIGRVFDEIGKLNKLRNMEEN